MKRLSLASLWILLLAAATVPGPGRAAKTSAEPAKPGKDHRVWSYPSVVLTDPVWTFVAFPLVPSDQVAPGSPAP